MAHDDFRDTCSLPRCGKDSVYSFLCKVEGTDARLCAHHRQEWSATVARDPSLAPHCPRCKASALQRRESQASAPQVVIADEPLTGPLALAIEEAMLREGVDIPTRHRILRRLAASPDVYVSAIMSQNWQTT